MDARLILAYLFLCFSVGLTCLGVTIALARRPGGQLARAFLLLYGALSVLVLSSLLLALPHAFPDAISPTTRSFLEYGEAMIGSYGTMFALPFFIHRLFGVDDWRRDRWLLAFIALAFIGQHVTEYVLGGAWDQRGDIAEDILFGAVVTYTIVFALRRRKAPILDRGLTRKVLAILAVALPSFVYDLLFVGAGAFRAYPLTYCLLSVVVTWHLVRHPAAPRASAPVPDWGLSRRETEVLALVCQGLSNKDIAAELHISPNTVKTHLRALFEKSGARSRFELISRGATGPSSRPGLPDPEQAAVSGKNHPGG